MDLWTASTGWSVPALVSPFRKNGVLYYSDGKAICRLFTPDSFTVCCCCLRLTAVGNDFPTTTFDSSRPELALNIRRFTTFVFLLFYGFFPEFDIRCHILTPDDASYVKDLWNFSFPNRHSASSNRCAHYHQFIQFLITSIDQLHRNIILQHLQRECIVLELTLLLIKSGFVYI